MSPTCWLATAARLPWSPGSACQRGEWLDGTASQRTVLAGYAGALVLSVAIFGGRAGAGKRKSGLAMNSSLTNMYVMRCCCSHLRAAAWSWLAQLLTKSRYLSLLPVRCNAHRHRGAEQRVNRPHDHGVVFHGEADRVRVVVVLRRRGGE